MTADPVPDADAAFQQLTTAFADLRQYLSTPTRAISGAENALCRIETTSRRLDDTHTRTLLLHGCGRIREEIDAMRTTNQKRTTRQRHARQPFSTDPRHCQDAVDTPCTSAELRCDRAIEYLDGMAFQLDEAYGNTLDAATAD